ncbi:C-type lectin domain family 6 member A isoform X1 [Ptiloglossa arizonensis]|uniref:C-type lectin domain family 6 member A isoform X1 n=1 Tax=Ptiloglossa arizonensis TaxID=3350558 RepID=UPI003FA07F2A
MNRISIILTLSTVYLISNIVSYDRCCRINSRQLTYYNYYKLIKSNARSNQSILSRTTVSSVNECKKFAMAKKALAFNYGSETNRHEWEIGNQNKNNNARMTCQALECPEIYNFTTFVRDKNYKYYSMYLDSISTGTNFTLACVPRTGVFVFSSNNLNYSQAQISCQKMNASVAHIISEERTNGLAKYISQNTPTFVGLGNRDRENIWKNEFDEPLSCFKYRAWGKEEPSHSKGCVGLVQPSNKSELGPYWKVLPCDSTLRYVCEISPLY